METYDFNATPDVARSEAAAVMAGSDFAHPHDSRPFDAGTIAE